jgi:uncharacterized repeat protein (TIGR03847 family)
MARLRVFDVPARFIVGTVGQPGERAFYLQAADAGDVVTVALEKQEVSALAEGLLMLLTEVRKADVTVPPPPLEAPVDPEPLVTPFDEDFRVEKLSVSWDEGRVVLEAAGPTPADPEGETVLRVRLSPEQTYAFVARAELIISAGRAKCILCGRPDGPAGHVCPRLN